MTSMQPLWWFALPVLLLPVWWHMRKRERTRSDLLATAHFLPAAAPQQQRMLRWSDVLLLLARLALLVVLIAWLAVLTTPWKGDTVFIAAGLERSAWAEQQIQAAGMGAAERRPLPADVWNWLARNEHEWRPGARFLVLADSAPMPALPPRLAHPTDLRLPPPAAPGHATSAAAPDAPGHAMSAAAPAAPGHATPATAPTAPGHATSATAATAPAVPGRAAPASAAAPAASGRAASPAAAASAGAPRERHVVVVAPAERMARWQALFAAFGTAGDGANRYILTDTPTPATELIVWDRLDADPPLAWKAPLWWRTAAASGQTQGKQGLAWTAPNWPLQDVDAARALYERWQAATARPAAYPMPAQAMKAERQSPLPTALARSPEWLAIALLALFAIERILTHVRRRS